MEVKELDKECKMRIYSSEKNNWAHDFFLFLTQTSCSVTVSMVLINSRACGSICMTDTWNIGRPMSNFKLSVVIAEACGATSYWKSKCSDGRVGFEGQTTERDSSLNNWWWAVENGGTDGVLQHTKELVLRVKWYASEQLTGREMGVLTESTYPPCRHMGVGWGLVCNARVYAMRFWAMSGRSMNGFNVVIRPCHTSGLRMRNECHFLAFVDIRFLPVWCFEWTLIIR